MVGRRMNDPQQQYEQPQSPFEEGPSQDPQGPPEQESKAFDLWGLRNSQPHVTPAEIGHQLDLTAKWYEHLFCGFLKQSNSDAAEAWQHYVIAIILLADQEIGLLSEDDREAIAEESDEWEMPDDER